MLIVHASDLHGHRPAYEKLFLAARHLQADAVVLAGDLLPHPHDPGHLLEGQLAFIDEVLKPLLVQLWHDRPDLPVLAIPGNDDFEAATALLQSLESQSGLRWLVGKSHQLGPYVVRGAPWVPITPFFMSDFDRLDSADWWPAIEPSTILLTDTGQPRVAELEDLCRRPTVEAELEALAPTEPAETCIYLVHTPPANTQLDCMRGGVHIGSPALRRFIERHQPLLTLHGHVHESPGLTGAFVDRIGRTVCVNAGASLMGLRGLKIELDGTLEPRVQRL